MTSGRRLRVRLVKSRYGPRPAGDATRREDYLLRSHPGGLQVIGATDVAVEYAVWDLLHRLGHRQFFPGKTWEIVPPAGDLALAAQPFSSHGGPPAQEHDFILPFLQTPD